MEIIYYCLYSETGMVEIEMKDTFSRYTNDVIASCAFGLKVNSLQDKENEFYEMGKKFSNPNFLQLLKFMAYSISPKLMKVNKYFKIITHRI